MNNPDVSIGRPPSPKPETPVTDKLAELVYFGRFTSREAFIEVRTQLELPLQAALARVKELEATQPVSEVEESVITKIRARRDAGRKKYGTSMERTDLTEKQWLIHAQEEALDLAIYLQKLINLPK